MSSPAADVHPLLARAGDEIGQLSQTEATLISTCAIGDIADFGAEAKAECRVSVLRWLIVNSGVPEANAVHRIRARHLRASDGALDLEGVSLAVPLVLEHCRFGEICIRDAQLVTIELSGTHCHGIAGDRVRIAHGLLLDEGFCSLERVGLWACRVGDDLNCIGGRFAAGGKKRSALGLDGAHIGGRLFLTGAIVASRLKLEEGKAAVSEERYERSGGLSAQGCRISGNLVAIEATFSAEGRSALNLQSAEIAGDGAFERMTADAGVRMRQTTFNGTVTFTDATLAGNLDLSRVSVGADLRISLESAGMSDRQLLLGGASIEGRLVLPLLSPTSPEKSPRPNDLSHLSRVDLSQATLGYLDDRKAVWPEENSIGLEGLRLGGIAVSQPTSQRRWKRGKDETWLGKRLRWLKAQDEEAWSPQPYGQVVEALGQAGQDSLARAVAIRRERDRFSRGGLFFVTRIWNLLLRATVAYGYKPFRAFAWGLAVIALCWLVYRGTFGAIEWIPGDDPPTRYALVLSIDIFLPIVDLGQTDAWKPLGIWPNIVVWLEIGFGWLLTTLGVAGITGLIRSD